MAKTKVKKNPNPAPPEGSVQIPPASKAKVRAAEEAKATEEAEAESLLRTYRVTIVRVVEQHAHVIFPARSAEDAESAVTQQLDNRNPVLLRSLKWSDGELEAGETVLDVRAVDLTKK